MHNPPPAGHSLDHQRKQPPRMLTSGHGKLPAPGDYGGPPVEQVNFQILKRKLAHLLAFALVALLVALQSRLPAFGNGGPGKERNLGGMPVPVHVLLQVAAIPGIDLVHQGVLDPFLGVGAHFLIDLRGLLSAGLIIALGMTGLGLILGPGLRRLEPGGPIRGLDSDHQGEKQQGQSRQCLFHARNCMPPAPGLDEGFKSVIFGQY